MAKKTKSRLIFAICLLVYTVLFLAATAVGLKYLWDYMASYELSRPKHAVDGYMQQLTADYICGKSAELIAKTDASVQSEEDCRRVITEALSGKFTCVKNLGESTDEKTVYLIRCGSRIIGRFTIAPGEEVAHGFAPWKVVSDSFDLSYLLTPGHTVTVPTSYSVNCNGAVLDDTHITASGIQFPLLEEFYDDYNPPTLVTYQTGATLGPVTLTVTDSDGTPVTIDESAGYDALLPACPSETAAKLTAVTTDFLWDYVDFTSCTNNDIYGNHDRLQAHILPNSALSKRMNDAIAGLYLLSMTAPRPVTQ